MEELALTIGVLGTALIALVSFLSLELHLIRKTLQQQAKKDQQWHDAWVRRQKEIPEPIKLETW